MHEDEIEELTNRLIDDITKDLVKMKKLLKYSVLAFIQQKNGSGLSYFGAGFLEDVGEDKVVKFFDEHPNLDVAVVVLGIKITQK